MKRVLAFVYNNVDVFQGEFRSQVGSRDRDCVFVFLCVLCFCVLRGMGCF